MAIKRLSKPIKSQRIIIVVAVAVVACFLAVGLATKRFLFDSVVTLPGEEPRYVYIPTGADFDDVMVLLTADGMLTDEDAVRRMAVLMNYPAHIRPGRYKLTSGLSARKLLQMLRGGMQSPVRVTFTNVRTLEQLAGVVAKHLEADSASLLSAMADTALIKRYGLTPQTSTVIYLPDSYEVWWNISPENWVDKMADEHDKFWNHERMAKADSIGLTPNEVTTLASIVQEECNLPDEQKIIAGLYLNRLKINMPLQACPTIKFALGDFSIRRVKLADTKVESPYNTYIHPGLPPGPIRITSKSVIDAVLNPTPSDYLFMCAKPDGSGRHDYSRTLAGHQRNAAKYHKLLNSKKIYR